MDKKKLKVLLLSAPIGSGHRMAAEAIKEELADYNNVEVVHGNVFSFFPKVLGDTFLAVYLWILKVCPCLYQMTYAWGNKQSGSLWLRNLINKALMYLGSSYLQKINPDIVIATHATPTGIMSFYKEKHPEIFLGVVVTDFTVHKWWICPNVDTYFVADERLVTKFPANDVVKAFGIPIRKAFSVDNAEELRTNFSWQKEEKVCLIMGGGDGLLPMEGIISSLNKYMLENLRIVCVCGKNENLKKQLELKFGNQENVEVVGFTDKAPDYMKAADIVVTKAGGLTSSEVLACGLEFLIYKPLPGQEQNNASFLERNYGACVYQNIADLTAKIGELCKISEMNPRLKYHGKDSTKRICEYVLDTARQKS